MKKLLVLLGIAGVAVAWIYRDELRYYLARGELEARRQLGHLDGEVERRAKRDRAGGGTIFKYTDEQGTVHYVDSVAAIPEQYRTQAREPDLPDVAVYDARTPIEHLLRSGQYGDPDAVVPPGPEDTVIVYTAPGCPYCDKAVKLLRELDLPADVRDVEKDPRYLKELVARVGNRGGVPVLVMGGRTIAGFNEPAIRTEAQRMFDVQEHRRRTR
jgi:glutaredoxin